MNHQSQDQLQRVRKILNEIKLTPAYEHYSREVDRTEERLAVENKPNQCPNPYENEN
jgi:hypothetical protein